MGGKLSRLELPPSTSANNCRSMSDNSDERALRSRSRACSSTTTPGRQAVAPLAILSMPSPFHHNANFPHARCSTLPPRGAKGACQACFRSSRFDWCRPRPVRADDRVEPPLLPHRPPVVCGNALLDRRPDLSREAAEKWRIMARNRATNTADMARQREKALICREGTLVS